MPSTPLKSNALSKLLCFCFSIALLWNVRAQPQTTAKESNGTKAMSYAQRLVVASFGNFAGWWGLMSENEKLAFLDGYQTAMEQANQHERNVCEALRKQAANDTNLSVDSASHVVFMCSEVSETGDYDKLSVKDVDAFYLEPLNAGIPMAYSLGWLRDKARGLKTKGQLIDALDQYQQTFKAKKE